MNGFVVFERDDAADQFLRSVDAIAEHFRSHLVRSSTEPLFTFRNVTAQDVKRIRELAREVGGHVRESMKYATLG